MVGNRAQSNRSGALAKGAGEESDDLPEEADQQLPEGKLAARRGIILDRAGDCDDHGFFSRRDGVRTVGVFAQFLAVEVHDKVAVVEAGVDINIKCQRLVGVTLYRSIYIGQDLMIPIN